MDEDGPWAIAWVGAAWRLALILGGVALLLTACRAGPTGEPLELHFNFAAGDHGWVADFVDLPVDFDPAIYELEAALAPRPEELGEGTAFLLRGHNRSDDLFAFLKRQLGPAEGLEAGRDYGIVIEVTFGTHVPAGLFGIGGPPGEAVWVKVGAAPEEPVPVVDELEWYRLNLDKGGQSQGGDDAVVVGDITKPAGDEDQETFVLKSLDNAAAPVRVTADADGTLWVFVGTDSGFEGLTTLYYTDVRVTLTPR